MKCPACKKRGTPEHFGSPVKCAFENKNKTFSSDNWQCATMNRLRVFSEEHGTHIYGNDESISILGIPEGVGQGFGFLVMTWYKNRGQTGNAVVMSTDNPVYPLTLGLAQELINYYKG